MTDVTDIGEKRKEKKKKERENDPRPIPQAEVYRAVMDAINRHSLSLLPEFPRRYYVVAPEPGVRLVLREDAQEIVRYVHVDAVMDDILSYTQTGAMQAEPDYRFTVAQAKAAREFWLRSTGPVDEPPAVRWDDEPGKTFRRLPWRKEIGETPVWDELLGRMSDPDAFRAWVGSLFFPASDRQQYLWLYGEGQNGKGAISRFLARVFGQAHRGEQAPSPDDKFWTLGLIGKRLVSFPDTNAKGFCGSGLFKSLTGDDDIRCEIKGGASFSTKLTCKFLFSSNERPTLSSETADMRRAILVELRPIKGDPDPAYEERLWDEGGRFLASCIAWFDLEYPKHGRISVDQSKLKSWVGTLEDKYAVVASDNFTFPKFFKGLRKKDWPYVTPKKMQDVLRENFPARNDQLEFLKYLERKHKVSRRFVKIGDGTAEWRYLRIESLKL